MNPAIHFPPFVGYALVVGGLLVGGLSIISPFNKSTKIVNTIGRASFLFIVFGFLITSCSHS